MLRTSRKGAVAAAILLLAFAPSILADSGRANASFGGANADLDFGADCGNGQQVWSVSSSSASNTCASYTAQTAGATDAMPYVDSSGSRMFFSSNRNSGLWTIYMVPYSNASNV